MSDRRSALALLVEAELKKPDVMKELRDMAQNLAHEHEADAQDLFSKSLVRVVDPDLEPWQPGGHSFLAHMYMVMRRARYRQWRKVWLASEVLDSGVAQENTANDDPRVDDEAERTRRLTLLRKLGERVLARLGSDLFARQLYETAMKEDLDPAEEAARFRRTPKEVKAAHTRLAYHGRLVRDEWDASEERRMKALRQQARTQREEDTP
jgi:hypothetical protein